MKVLKHAAQRKELERPLPELLAVMCMCNKAHFERTRRSMRRVCTQMALEKELREQKIVARQTKTFRVVDQTGHESVRVPSTNDLCKMEATLTGEGMEEDPERWPKARKRTNDLIGSPSEVALLRYVEMVASVEGIRNRYKLMLEIPFNSVRRWQLVVVKCLVSTLSSGMSAGTPEKRPQFSRFLTPSPTTENSETSENSENKSQHFTPPSQSAETDFSVMIKGAPEVILSLCSDVLMANELKPIDEQFRHDCQAAWDHFGSEGRRVFAFAHRQFRAPGNTKFSVQSENYPKNGLTFLGMAAMMDPPRNETAAAIQQCKDAGIKVFMITGDHPSAASAIASQIGLTTTKNEVRSRGNQQIKLSLDPSPQIDWAIVLGESLTEMSVEEWDRLLTHKYIVFARTTPEQKLLIVEQCQKRGETVAVTGGGVNDAPALAKANIGIAMGVNGSDIARRAADMWILSIDLASELPPAISLAYESPERDIMKVPPRNRNTELVSSRLLLYSYLFSGTFITIGCVASYLSVYW
uniref:Cation-transporting P-type ATPase C-terminal domain-containing protein n=1 Tax=Meloidogyne javanica TaxID=6303 RepID=A0A915MWH9_MELJA